VASESVFDDYPLLKNSRRQHSSQADNTSALARKALTKPSPCVVDVMCKSSTYVCSSSGKTVKTRGDHMTSASGLTKVSNSCLHCTSLSISKRRYPAYYRYPSAAKEPDEDWASGCGCSPIPIDCEDGVLLQEERMTSSLNATAWAIVRRKTTDTTKSFRPEAMRIRRLASYSPYKLDIKNEHDAEERSQTEWMPGDCKRVVSSFNLHVMVLRGQQPGKAIPKTCMKNQRLKITISIRTDSQEDRNERKNQ
jgi:hypothetical protein